MALPTCSKSELPISIAQSPMGLGEPMRQREELLMSIRLQQELIRHACRGIPTTYRQLLRSVGTVTDLDETLVRASLERLMDEDAIAARPFVTSLVIGPQAGGLPEPWFFSKARMSGRLAPLSDELEAWAFHARELQRAVSYYRTMSSNAVAASGVGAEA